MAIREVNYPSFNGRDTIKAWVYTSIRKPRAIVQVVHGFGEHSRRYLHMILKLNEAGFVVCANDHVGHGKTAYDSDTWMDFGDKGYMTTAEDEHILRQLVQKDFPGIPYVMFGHSWGSMIARNYAAHYGQGMDALVICGTAAVMPGVPEMDAELKKLLDEGKGKTVEPEFLGRLFAGMTDRYDEPKTTNSWIALDPDVVADHGADPFNNFNAVPNVQSFYDFIHQMIEITGTKWAEKVPKELPIYNIAGDQDPVGNFGQGVYEVSNWLWNTGHKVKTRLYSGYRHEIHNERGIRDEVVDGIIEFIDGIL